MEDFSNLGFKQREMPECNYKSVWHNLKTTRLAFGGDPMPLPAEHAEFYDVSLGTKCNGKCPFCYTNAGSGGRYYTNVVEKIKHLAQTIWSDPNHKPYQVAIGSQGEPTIHPEFTKVLQTFYELGIVPNYTTNGLALTNPGTRDFISIMEMTEWCVGGVAVSVNDHTGWRKAIPNLLEYGDTKVNIHLIISDVESVQRLKWLYKHFGDAIHTYVILPLMPQGRSEIGMDVEAFHELQKVMDELGASEKGTRFAMGANFYSWLQNEQDPELPKIECDMYEPEMYSKNLILDDPIIITPSSFNEKTILWSERWNG